MDKQNITLSIPKDVLQKIKLLAVKKGTSVSGLMAHVLEEIVAEEEGYQDSRLRHLALLEQGLDLGSKGSRSWTREDLHAR
ncbi:MAG: hypothetical protein KAS38_01090 [Anaerolineales bacterium]|nr:hypothetical protein [Anaerolineales bacterium]MCK4978038.1 hypothetical protein [Anaerolineales bacterium]